MRITAGPHVEPGQTFLIDRFRPEDAAGVAGLFLAIYGDVYPLETYYFPERIIEENAKGNLYSVVARTPRGDIVAHGALYRSSPPNPLLFEQGQYLVLKPYRQTQAAYEINRYLAEQVAPQTPLCGFFGEAVCNHMASQKAARQIGGSEVAIEMDLMPPGAYHREGTPGRVSCVVTHKPLRDRPQVAHFPPVYRRELEHIVADLGLDREYRYACQELKELPSRVDSQIFSQAGVARFHVAQAGADFPQVVERLSAQAEDAHVEVLQWFVNAADSGAGTAVEVLRSQGCFLGGFVPCWFDSDAVLVQRVKHRPGFETARLLTDKAKWLLHYVRQDWDRTRRYCVLD